MLENINPYYIQWNTDVNGNPISVHKQEMQQVSPVYLNNIEIEGAANW